MGSMSMWIIFVAGRLDHGRHVGNIVVDDENDVGLLQIFTREAADGQWVVRREVHTGVDDDTRAPIISASSISGGTARIPAGIPDHDQGVFGAARMSATSAAESGSAWGVTGGANRSISRTCTFLIFSTSTSRGRVRYTGPHGCGGAPGRHAARHGARFR